MDSHNERVKLLANLLNAIAASTIVAGAIAPVAGAIVFTNPQFNPGGAIFGIVLWTAIGAILHVGGWRILEELR